MGVLLWVGRRYGHRLRRGDLLLLYLIWYPLERSALEFLRSDNWKIGPIPTAHIVSVVLVTLAVAALVWWRRPAYLSSGGGRSGDESGDEGSGGQSRSSQRRARRRGASSEEDPSPSEETSPSS